MKYIILASLLSTAAFAAPMAQQGQGNGASQAGAGTAGAQTGTGQTTQQQQGGAQQQQGQGAQNVPTGGATAQQGQTPSANDLATAVSNWQADTSMVSNFLNTGASIQNNVAFKQAATVAFNAEVDELNHKAIIDAANSQQPNVISANSTLATGGAFQDVVDKLQIMSQQGRAAVANIDLINQNRCVNVLPNIDAYMASTGSASQAVRPDVCDQTGVAGGVQGQGPTLPGQAPGTPQAAFDAASALAAGTGNGQVQNGGAQGQAGGAQGQAGGAQGQAGGVQGQAGGAQGQAGGAQGQAGGVQGQAGGAQGQAGGAGAQNLPTGQQTGQQQAGGATNGQQNQATNGNANAANAANAAN
ncbi:hypothetical protein CC80DRAFT_589360 [Byssothecium circinans]|uniref:Uncharacterized protein n=1 Tax=Byssothecium circinans TaxID=147558 RepID=A0A6A5UG37_9PLEO|nr:hypothetical protein CC80DRAFT_589360 [Byssothecium circinans]